MTTVDYRGRPVYPGMPVTREEHARAAEWIAAECDQDAREILARRDAMASEPPAQTRRAARERCDRYDALTLAHQRKVLLAHGYRLTAQAVRSGEAS